MYTSHSIPINFYTHPILSPLIFILHPLAMLGSVALCGPWIHWDEPPPWCAWCAEKSTRWFLFVFFPMKNHHFPIKISQSPNPIPILSPIFLIQSGDFSAFFMVKIGHFTPRKLLVESSWIPRSGRSAVCLRHSPWLWPSLFVLSKGWPVVFGWPGNPHQTWSF